jgi:hypothetical protein
VPVAPTGLAASTVSDSQINLNWIASATSGVQYEVFRGTTSGFTPAAGNLITPTPISATTYSDTGLAASTQYYYVVEATNANGTSPASSQVSATTAGEPVVPVAPSAPTGLSASTVSSSQINLSWTASATSGVQYEVFRSTTSGFTPAAGNLITPTPISATTYSDAGLAASTQYYYVVEATNSNGTSPASNQVSATTTSASVPDFTVAASPASLTVTSGAAGTATITVTPVNGFDSAVSFTCSGLPVGATCSFAPATVTPSGTAASTTTLTVKASATSAALHRDSNSLFPGSALAVALCFFGWRKRRYAPFVMLLAVSVLGLTLFTGCGGSSPAPQSTTSTVTVTATSGSLQHSATFSLTVQ